MTDGGQRRGRLFFYGLFALLAILVLYILSPYIGAILTAIVTVIVIHPLYDYFLARKWVKGRSTVATTLTLISFFLLIIVPLSLLGILIYHQGAELLETIKSAEFDISLTNLVSKFEDFLHGIPPLSAIEISQEVVADALISAGAAVLGWMIDLAASLGTSLPALFVNVIIFLVVVATMLSRMSELGNRAQEISPLDVSITQIYLQKGQEMIISVIKGVFLLAIIQGLIMGIFYWLAGVPFNVFFTLLSMAFALLPVVGISFIVLPMALVYILSSDISSAAIVLIGFYVFVNPTDLTLRPRLVSKEAYLNFTLMLLALFGGLALGGLLGMIYGPVIMILFVTTIDIYANYFANRHDQPPANQTSLAGTDEAVESFPAGTDPALTEPTET